MHASCLVPHGHDKNNPFTINQSNIEYNDMEADIVMDMDINMDIDKDKDHSKVETTTILLLLLLLSIIVDLL